MKKKRVAWNKGLTTATDTRVARITKKLKDGWKNKKYIHRPPKDIIKWKKNLSKKRQELLNTNPNLFANYYNRGFVKIYKYKDVLFQGTWELRFAIWCDKNNIKWIKNIDSFNYIYQEKEHKYFPDFYLPETDTYVEIKGFKTEKDDYKWKQFPKDKKLFIITKSQFNNFGINKVLDLKECKNFLNCTEEEKLLQINHCKNCGKEISKGSTHCKKCVPHKRKVERPTKEELQELIKNNSFVSLGKRFGVSDVMVRKWCKSYGIILEKYYYQNHFY